MTLEQAYNQLSQRNKYFELVNAGYKSIRCDCCKGTGYIYDIKTAVYYQTPYTGNIKCRNCGGEGTIWLAPTIR